jgi:hypothetical protein
MENSRLYQALTNFKCANGDWDVLAKEFMKVAQAAFHSGYFKINGAKEEYKIEITCIEFYYEEIDGKIKDPHKYLKGQDGLDYPIGALCPNESGIDIMFENPQNGFYASFLIRGYKSIYDKPNSKKTIVYENKTEKGWRTRDLWYELIGASNMLSSGRFAIEWIDNGEDYSNIPPASIDKRINLKEPDNREWRYIRED